MQRNLKFLYLLEIFSGLSRGSYLVCIGWTTLVISGDVARVGQVFIIAMLTTILAGPLLGVVVDRYDRKYLAIAAHLGIALTMAGLGVAWVSDDAPALIWLFLGVAAITAFRLLHHTAHDGLIQANVATETVVGTIARFRAVHLTSTAIGTVAAGSVIERLSPNAGFLFSAAASLLLIAPAIFVAGVVRKQNAPGLAGFFADLAGGFDVFRTNRGVRLVTILAGISLPIGQLSNAILSSFIRDDLGMGSEAFGIVDAAWPVGGMAAAAMLSLGLRRLSVRYVEYVFAALAGLFTIGLSLCTTVPLLTLLHCGMGVSVWLCRIMIDGRVMENCSGANIGRTKVYVEIVFSLSAMVMCFSPTLVRLPTTADYFLFWGGFMVAGALGVWLWDRRRPANRVIR